MEALSALETADERQQFLEPLCSPVELRNIEARWHSFQILMDGNTHRDARDGAKVSIATITQANSILKREDVSIFSTIRGRCSNE